MATLEVGSFVGSMFDAWHDIFNVQPLSPGHPLATAWMNAVASLRDETVKKFQERREPFEILQDDPDVGDAMVAMDRCRYTKKWIVRIMPFPPKSVLQDVVKWSDWHHDKCWHEVPNLEDWLNKSVIVKTLREDKVPIIIHDRECCYDMEE